MMIRTRILATCGAAALLANTAAAWAQTVESSKGVEAQDNDNNDVIVTGIRKSIEDAIEIKRSANSIVDVISAEDVGKLPDSNVAESLSRLPGVTVDHAFGEGEQVSIAGVEPALNRLTIDGHSVASADWGGNPGDRSSRTFNYSLLSPTVISQAVVYKTPEARLQEGAIGASIDIVTRKPFDLKPNTIALNGGYEYNDRASRGSFRGSALYSWHNDDDTIGFVGAINYDKEQLSRAGNAVYWYRTGGALIDSAPYKFDANGNATSGPTINGALPTKAVLDSFRNARYASFIAHEYFKQERQRIGFSGAIQARPTDNLQLVATALIIRGNYDNLSSSEYTYGYGDSNSPMTAATFIPASGATAGIVTSATFGAVAPGKNTANGQLDTNFRRTRIKNDTLTTLFDWKPGDWSVTGNLGWTRASGGKDPEYLLDFRTVQGFTAGANGRNIVVNWASPASDASKWLSNFTALGGEVIGDPGATAANGGKPFTGRQIGGIARKYDFTLDKEIFAEVNFKHPVEIGPFTELLFGARVVKHDNNQTTFGGAIYTNQNFTLADLNPYVIDADAYNGLGTSGNGTPYATLNKDEILAALTKYGTINVSRGLAKDLFFQVREKIAAGYVQMNFNSGKFRGNIGGRFVHTRDEPTFYINGATDPSVEARSDDRFLPAVNVIYDAGSDVVLRAAAAKVIARPRYSDLSASTSLDDTTRTGGGGNPDLKPYAATNFGVSAEWYFRKGSFLTGEIFYRDVSNYVSNKTADVELTNPSTGRRLVYNISTAVNGGTAKVTGFSLSGNTNLIWGFGIQANYTFTDAETSIGTGLPYLSRNVVTLVPYFERGPFQARLSYNRRSKYFYGFGRQQSQDYTDSYRQLDAQISYSIRQGISLTASAGNLLDETYYRYSSDPQFPTALYKNGRVFSLTANVKI